MYPPTCSGDGHGEHGGDGALHTQQALQQGDWGDEGVIRTQVVQRFRHVQYLQLAQGGTHDQKGRGTWKCVRLALW